MASKGEAFAPWSTAKLHSHSTSSALPATTPKVASLCPAMALVAECTTRSTPWSRGRWASGVAKVESTTVIGSGDGAHLVEVHQVEPGVGRGLGQHQGGLAGTHGAGQGTGLGAVDEGDLDPEARAGGLQQQLGTGVELALGHDVVALGAQAEHHRRDRPHARGEGPGALGPFQIGDGVLEPAHRRVAVAAVEPIGTGHGGHPPTLLDGRGDEGGGGPQDRCQRRVVVGPSGPDGAGLGVQRALGVGATGRAGPGRGGVVGVGSGVSHLACPPRQGSRRAVGPPGRSRAGTRRGRRGCR